MAIGLRGHLSALKMTDIYDYLTDGVVTTTVGVLIGMAANKRGSCDPAASKMLCLHIPSLLPSSFTGIDVASPAQAAAIAGIGLLYQGSSNRMMTEFLLEEMGKRPTNDSIMPDREAYALSCGLSLGMVNLAKGGNSSDGFGGIESGLADLDIGERLHRLVVGGIDHPEQQKRRKEAAERFSNITGNESESCFSIFEGDTVNTDVTAPGATLALGLMYLKSGNHAVASSMALPDTHFLLEYIRPDLLLLRVLSRAMILWDEVKPTRDWIEKQIPVVVQRSYHEMRSLVEGASAFPNRSSGGNNDSVGNVEPASALTGTTSGGRHDAVSSTFRDESIDKNAVRQIYVHIIAGACFGIGLRFAGTGDKQAASVVAEKLVELKILRDGNDQVSVALRPELQILEMCIGCTAISLAMIMAGTGNLETFNLLKTIRWRCDDDIGYGSHMAYGAAIGLLFLGGGSCTLGRSPEDIAALLMAFFPRLPSTTSDNQHHLQALRHCYALAVERREIRAVDSETGTIVSVPVEITFAEDSIPKKKITAPCLLLNSNGTAKTLQVLSEQYYPLAIDIGRKSTHASGITFFVKRKHGHLGSSGMTSSRRSLVVHADSGKISARKLVEAFTENPSVVAYSQYLCEDSSRPLSWVSNFCTRILEQCLRNNTIEALSLYLKLKSSVVAMKEDCPASIDAAWDTRLIRTYYAHSTISGSSTTRLLSAEFVSTLNELVEQTLSASPLDENDVLVYMKTGDPRQTVVKDVSQLGLLGSFLSFYGVPFPLPNDSNVDTS
jgi:anaphase-promoting complex subunit 1